MSQVNVADQAVSFLLAALLGAALGVFYCFFCALRRFGRNGAWEVFWQDLVFWLTAAVATFCFLLLRCRGEVRAFVYLGEAAGFLLLRILLAKHIIKFILFLLGILGYICRPLKAFAAAVSAGFISMEGFLRQKAEKWRKKFEKGRKKGLKAESEVLYNDQEFNA